MAGGSALALSRSFAAGASPAGTGVDAGIPAMLVSRSCCAPRRRARPLSGPGFPTLVGRSLSIPPFDRDPLPLFRASREDPSLVAAGFSRPPEKKRPGRGRLPAIRDGRGRRSRKRRHPAPRQSLRGGTTPQPLFPGAFFRQGFKEGRNAPRERRGRHPVLAAAAQGRWRGAFLSKRQASPACAATPGTRAAPHPDAVRRRPGISSGTGPPPARPRASGPGPGQRPLPR